MTKMRHGFDTNPPMTFLGMEVKINRALNEDLLELHHSDGRVNAFRFIDGKFEEIHRV